MAKRIALIGHCGPDASYLTISIRRAVADAQVSFADDEESLSKLLNKKGADLLLFNRELNYGFSESQGVDVIRRMRGAYPDVKMMLVSNYPQAHAAAVAA